MDGSGHDAAFLLTQTHSPLANLVVSLRLNTFTKIDLVKWLNEPFTPPPDVIIIA